MKTTTALLFILFIILDWITCPIFWLMRVFNRKKVPFLEDDVLRVSATKLADLIRKRKISCEEVIKTYIKRIKEVNPVLNAVVEDRFDDAIEDAKAVDKLLAETPLTEDELKQTKPLLGVPLTVKESCGLKGLSQSVGSLRYKDKKATCDSDVVARLKEAGAIPLLVSNTPELCLGWETSNHLTGKTYNPYKPAYASAGSSGGEGALLGSAASVIGIGSDLGGSIRIPSHCCGVFGHKPTARVVSSKGHFPYSPDDAFLNLISFGPIGRFAEDLPLMMKIMADDPSQLKLDEEVNLSELRIYVLERIGKRVPYATVDRDIVNLLEKSVNHFREVYQSKTCCKKFDFGKIMDIGLAYISEAANNLPCVTVNPDTNKKDLNAFLELFKSFLHVSIISFNAALAETIRVTRGLIPESEVPNLKKKKEELQAEVVKELGSDGVLFLPTFHTTAFQNGQACLRGPGYMYTIAFNLLGLPATHVPMGLGQKGLPIGIQVVAGPYQDKLCFAVARELEKRFGGWYEPEKF